MNPLGSGDGNSLAGPNVNGPRPHGTAPAGTKVALWTRHWHKINPGASRTYCGVLLPPANVHFEAEPTGAWKCSKCFKPWEYRHVSRQHP